MKKNYKMIKKRNAGEFDKFFTKRELAKKLIAYFNLDDFDHIIEPTAGNGSFSDQIPNCEAYDIEPQKDYIKKADFLELNFDYNPSKTLIIGNPPFGRQSSLALKILKKSSKIADTIGFILPKSFKKDSFKDRIPLTHSLELEIDLDENSFYVENRDYSVPCVFQIWKRNGKMRNKTKKYKTEDFVFCKKSENPDFAIRRVGFYAGNIFKDLDKNESSFYFIKSKNKDKEYIYKIIYNIDWSLIKNNTVGIKSISKNELIKSYLEFKEAFNE
jgi:hypothetical protein